MDDDMILERCQDEDGPWRAILIDSQCQGGKTSKCFELLHEKLYSDNGKKLVIFVTQANSITSVNQLIQRAKDSPEMKGLFPDGNIMRSCNVVNCTMATLQDGNYLVVDFWNAKNMKNIIEFMNRTAGVWKRVVVVVDEIEQAGLKGVRERLGFVHKVDCAAAATDAVEVDNVACKVNVIFITATVANLSKCIFTVALANAELYSRGLVHDIVNHKVVEHHYARPHTSYIGASWFMNTPNVWRKLVFPRKDENESRDEYNQHKQRIILDNIKALPDASKELSLIVTSTRTQDHKATVMRLFNVGYNVTVEFNGINNKNYVVWFLNVDGDVKRWTIPFSYIDARADKGLLSGIRQKDDYTLSHVLQASLFMNTDAEERILENITATNATLEILKLKELGNAICNQLYGPFRRPVDYPRNPKVALVAGHLAGRGITIQNPAIDFTCTSFCFTESKDSAQRGATNTQRLGRAFGMLNEIFSRPERQPILLATDGIMKDALANEEILQQKANMIDNGALVTLKELISEEDWNQVMASIQVQLRKEKKDVSGEVVDGVNINDLLRYVKRKDLIIGQMIRFLYKCDQSKPISFDVFRQGINYTKGEVPFRNNIDTGRSLQSVYGKLWIVSNNLVALNPSIRKVLDSINKNDIK